MDPVEEGFTAESGYTTIFKADPISFTKLAENEFGSEVFATPTICGGQIFMRFADRANQRRKESLYCIVAESHCRQVVAWRYGAKYNGAET